MEEALPAALVLEDDVALDAGFGDVAACAVEHIGTLGYIQFQTRPLRGDAPVAARAGEIAFRDPRVIPLRMSAQLVSQAAARRLLAATETFDRPVDSFLQMRWQTGQDIFVAVPSRVRDIAATIGGSTISVRRPLFAKIPREVKRAVYRARIRRLSRKAWP